MSERNNIMWICILILIAAICMGSALFSPGLSNTARAIIGFIGVCCLFLLILLYWQLLITLQTRNYQELEAVKMAWAEKVSKLDAKQLAFLDTHNIRVEVTPTPHGVEYVWVGPDRTEFAYEDIQYWARVCIQYEKFPYLPAQHGLGGWAGSDERQMRDALASFTKLVCSAGLASYPSGNQPAKWLIRAHEIPERLGVAMEEEEL